MEQLNAQQQQQQQIPLSVEKMVENLKNQLSNSVLRKSDLQDEITREDEKISKIRDTLQGIDLAETSRNYEMEQNKASEETIEVS